MSSTQVKKIKVHSTLLCQLLLTEVLDNCGSVAKACLLLMGRMRKDGKLDQHFQVKPEVLSWWVVGPFLMGHGCECGHEKREGQNIVLFSVKMLCFF